MTAETAQTTDCPLRDRHLRLALDFRELRPAVPGEGGEELAQHFSRARFALDRR